MSAPTPHVPLERIREAVARAVDETSLRKVAKAVGMSVMGLSHFIERESVPYRPTVRKLAEWYLRNAATRRELDDSRAAVALALLLDGIPDSRFLATRAKVRDAIREAYRESGVEPPSWVDSIVP